MIADDADIEGDDSGTDDDNNSEDGIIEADGAEQATAIVEDGGSVKLGRTV